MRGVAAGGTALAAQVTGNGQSQEGPSHQSDAKATGAAANEDRPGADFMLDVIKSLGIEYCAANPGSSFLGLHESIINYGGNANPELLTCCHEEFSAAIAHGYAKIEGKPMMIMVHGSVGLQHASMAIYNCYCDRVPMYIVLGNISNINYRRTINEWAHAVQDAPAMVRDFVKWDDTPANLPHFAESAVRAYKIAMTPPLGPTVIVADAEMQEEPLREKNLHIPKLSVPTPPQGDAAALKEVARMLVTAENPVLVAGRTARTPKGIDLLVELAETLQARVHDQRSRMNFPSSHPLYAVGMGAPSDPNVSDADIILGLDARDPWALTHKLSARNRFGIEARPSAKPGAKLITVSSLDLNHKSNYQDFGHYVEADLAIAADSEATLPALIEEVKRQVTPDRKRVFEARGAKIAENNRKVRAQMRESAAIGWDSAPISTARLSAELWNQIKNEDWSCVSTDVFLSFWPTRMWDFSKTHQWIGSSGAGGMGYGGPSMVGAALANRKHGRLSVAIVGDGDLSYAPSVLWTAAHHKIPLLVIVHNNGGYHEERMRLQLRGNLYNRGVDRAYIGTSFQEPGMDFAMIAKGYGLYSEGPIGDPNALAGALQRGIERVKKGEPALLDVISQPR